MSDAFSLPTEERALEYRRQYRGLIGVQSKIPVKDKAMLSLIYTPGVGDACVAVEREETGSFSYTCRANTMALVSDGTSVYDRGAAGIAVTKMLLGAGIQNIILCDTRGGIYEGRPERMNWIKEDMALITNREKLSGSLTEVLPDRDVFIGVSAPGVLTQDMIRTMAPDAIIFALANPVPEAMPMKPSLLEPELLPQDVLT
jgi:malic enzyme